MSTGPLDQLEQAIAEALANVLPGVVDQLAAIGGPRAYTAHQVAERLRVSDATVYRLIKDGDLPRVSHLSPVRVAATALDEFLAGKR